jgi:DNA-binding NtrC family response regulator
MSEENRTLLIVDDETRISGSIKRMLRSEKYDIHIADSGMKGLEILKENDIGVILSDLMMPEMDGVTFLSQAKKLKSDVVEILLTAHATLDNALSAINSIQLFGYLTKPWSEQQLKGTLLRAFEHFNLVKENRRLQKLTETQNRELKELNENLEGLVRIL